MARFSPSPWEPRVSFNFMMYDGHFFSCSRRLHPDSGPPFLGPLPAQHQESWSLASACKRVAGGPLGSALPSHPFRPWPLHGEVRSEALYHRDWAWTHKKTDARLGSLHLLFTLLLPQLRLSAAFCSCPSNSSFHTLPLASSAMAKLATQTVPGCRHSGPNFSKLLRLHFPSRCITETAIVLAGLSVVVKHSAAEGMVPHGRASA